MSFILAVGVLATCTRVFKVKTAQPRRAGDVTPLRKRLNPTVRPRRI